MFATDLHGDVAKGLSIATRLARDRSATLLVVHVLPLHADRGDASRYDALAFDQGDTRRALVALRPTDEGVPYRHVLEVGDPGDKLVELVNREGVELLVFEARRTSGASRWFGHGLTAQLVNRVSCPVVTYRSTAPGGREGRLITPRPGGLVEPEALNILLNARVEALLDWLAHSRQAVQRVAAAVADSAAAVYRGKAFDVGRAFLPRLTRLLSLELREHQRALSAVGVTLRHDETLYHDGVCPLPGPAFDAFLSRVDAGGSAVSLPFSPDPASLSSVDGRSPLVIAAGAAIEVGASKPLYLVFTFDATRDFLRILAQPGPEPSIETYAFDGQGMMLSNSRFPDQLRSVGLLPDDASLQTPRRLRVCDPGRDLTLEAPSAELQIRAHLPLSRMAQAATAGEDGHDFVGYRDYRGVTVIGAWRWLSEYGFGVAAEMDLAAAARRDRQAG